MSLPVGAGVDLFVPGSAANLGPGFDSFGLALGVTDSYRATVREQPGLHVDLGPDPQGVPNDERHLVVASMFRALDELGVARPAGLELVCRNTIRMGRGMGSSAAAIVAGIALADALRRPEAGEGAAAGIAVPLDLAFVNDLAAALEGHPDNSSASVFGGATLSCTDDSDARDREQGIGAPGGATGAVGAERGVPHILTTRLALHPDIEPVVFVPASQLSTRTARAVLPAQIPHTHAALNSARAALLVHALTTDPSALLPATREWLHQEQRRVAYPEAMALVDTLRGQGHAAVISGAGPSVLVLTTAHVAATMQPPASTQATWAVLRPGVPATGVRAVRATLGTSLGEHADARQIEL